MNRFAITAARAIAASYELATDPCFYAGEWEHYDSDQCAPILFTVTAEKVTIKLYGEYGDCAVTVNQYGDCNVTGGVEYHASNVEAILRLFGLEMPEVVVAKLALRHAQRAAGYTVL